MLNLKTLDIKILSKCRERKFRKEVVIPLLREHLKAEHVMDLQGTNEQGIDVYFEFPDIFRRPRRYGIQLKIGDLKSKGRTDKNPNIVEVCNQIEQAFGKPIPLIDKTSVIIDGFYVIITGSTNELARNYIYQKRVKYPHLYIIEGVRIKCWKKISPRRARNINCSWRKEDLIRCGC